MVQSLQLQAQQHPQQQLHKSPQAAPGSSSVPSLVERRLSHRASSPGKKQPSSSHKRIPSDVSESSIFFPKMSNSPPPPRPPTRMISRERPTASSVNRLSDFKRYSTASTATSASTLTTRRTSYTPATSTNESVASSMGVPTRTSSLTGVASNNAPPSAPLPPPQAKRTSPAAPVVIRPVSRQRIVKRPGSRVGQVGGINPALMRIQNSRVEELKTKIYELEEVLQSEKAEREASVTRVEQIKTLESMLSKERYEKEMINMKLKHLMQNSQAAGSNPSSPNMSGSDSATLADDERIKYYQERISELEARLENDSSTRDDTVSIGSTDTDEEDDRGMLSLQTEVSVLKSENKLLKREKDNYQSTLRRQEDEIRVVKNRLQKLEPEYISAADKLKESEIKLSEHKERATTLESQLSNKDLFIKERLSILEDIEIKHRELDVKARDLHEKLEKATEESDRYRIERDDLQRQVQGFLTSRKQTERQIAGLERDNRRAKRLITALETSLQDLKISLEEKAMENDELNRSILKVMEQANETIEGAKRHSLRLTSPPLGSDHRNSMDTFSASGTPYIGSPDVTRNSMASSRFSRNSGAMSPRANDE
jgi:hypothetical protein